MAGTVTGWMDVPLSDFGRKQAFLLSQALTVEACGKIHCSDLKRSIDTTFYAMAFPDIQEINCAKELREINFGTHEGLHFDNLPTSEKKRFADPNFQAIGGESW